MPSIWIITKLLCKTWSKCVPLQIAWRAVGCRPLKAVENVNRRAWWNCSWFRSTIQRHTKPRRTSIYPISWATVAICTKKRLDGDSSVVLTSVHLSIDGLGVRFTATEWTAVARRALTSAVLQAANLPPTGVTQIIIKEKETVNCAKAVKRSATDESLQRCVLQCLTPSCYTLGFSLRIRPL